MKKLCVWAVAALLMAACTPKAEKATDSGLLQSKFQTEVDGKKTDLFTLRNPCPALRHAWLSSPNRPYCTSYRVLWD